ncbi:MAG: hypothetical protein GY710_14690 [Desulfobacteraceae bacterium]|nr:hypothetical protein [Desulfobacteraceae bacterium]
MMIKFMGKTKINKECYIYRTILLMFFCLTISGCCLTNQPGKIRPELNELKAGETAFFKRKYTQAETIFTSILNKNPDPNIKNTALYNLACTKLARSENKAEFIKAMELLNKWLPSKPAKAHFENPQLLIQSIREIEGLKKQDQLESLEKNKKINAIVENQTDKIIKLEKSIKTLKYQISELENIDHEVQEKRQAN